MDSRRQNKSGQTGSDVLEIDNDNLRELLQNNHEKQWISYTLPIPEIDPLAYVEQVSGEDHLYYWEHPEKDFALAAGGSAKVLKATGSNRFTDISEQSLQLRSNLVALSGVNHSLAKPILVGGYSFSDHNVHKMWKNFGAARFVLPEWLILKTGKLFALTLTVPCLNRTADEVIDEFQVKCEEFHTRYESIKAFRPATGLSQESSAMLQADSSFRDWEKQVNRSRQMISKGVFKKIVIARQVDIESDRPISVPRTMFYLRRQFPECFNFMIKVDGGPSFIGATPERLVSLKRNMMQTEGLAGSISRGESASEDMALGLSLMESKKDRSEHDFVVKDIRNNLKRNKMQVKHPRQPGIKKLSNVQHLYTPITAEIIEDITLHELAGMLHPTPAVGGFPKQAAVPYITEIEDIDRGWYAGPVGWYSLNGSGEFAVAIRSAWVEGNRARLFAGCGIVKNSDPEKEWAETEMKLTPIIGALNQANKDMS